MTAKKNSSSFEEQSENDLDGVSLKEFISKLNRIISYLFKKWLIIASFMVLGSLSGYLFSYLKPVKYIASITFVIEGAGVGGGGGMSSLAGQFGLDIGASASNSFFSGENIMLFLKSKNLIREVLLSKFDNNSGITLVDYYLRMRRKSGFFSKLNKEPEKYDLFQKNKIEKLTRSQDSLMQICVEEIINKNLTIEKPNLKSSFIEVKLNSIDELFSQVFITKLVATASERYLESKNKNKLSNLISLERKADSLTLILNNKTYNAAVSQQDLVDANPALKTNSLPSEISSREKAIVATIYSEVIKNLEFSRTLLSQETPVIQIVDQTTFPLYQEKINKVKSIMIGGFLSIALVILYLIMAKWMKSQMNF